MSANDEYVIDILQGVGLINRTQATGAMDWAQKNDRPVVDALVQMGAVQKSM